MNGRSELDTDRRIDLLVDGELSLDQQREILLRFEDDPGRWRDLALAFVEAAALRRHCREIAEPDRAPGNQRFRGVPPFQRNGKRNSKQHGISAPLAETDEAAAARENRRANPRRLLVAVTYVSCIAVGVAVGMSVATRLAGRDSGTEIGSQVAAAPGDAAVSQSPTVASGAASARRVIPAGHPADAAPQFRVPLIPAEQAGGELLGGGPVVPRDVRRAFEQLGHHVQGQRSWVPVRLHDGRRALIPIDDIEVRFVGRGPYQ